MWSGDLLNLTIIFIDSQLIIDLESLEIFVTAASVKTFNAMLMYWVVIVNVDLTHTNSIGVPPKISRSTVAAIYCRADV